MLALFDSPWRIAGWVMAVLAAPLLVRVLMVDRARGRRRCPKCWYGMDGVPANDSSPGTHPKTFVCPECGHPNKGERSLLRARTRLKLLPLAVLVLLAAYGLWAVPRVAYEGRTGLWPTTVLACLAPGMDLATSSTWRDGLRKALDERFNEDMQYEDGRASHRVWGWQKALAVRAAAVRYTLAPHTVSGESVATLPPDLRPVLRRYDIGSLAEGHWEDEYLRYCVQPSPSVYLGKKWVDRCDDVADIVTSLAASTEWVCNGGDQAHLVVCGAELLVLAPEKVQREVSGVLTLLNAPASANDHVVHTPELDAAREGRSDSSTAFLAVHDLQDFLGRDIQARIRADESERWTSFVRSDAEVLGEVLSVITDTVSPDAWLDNGGDIASRRLLGTRLIVQAPAAVQAEVVELLALFRDPSAGRIRLKGTWPPLNRTLPAGAERP